MDLGERSNWFRKLALEEGFEQVGFAKAQRLDKAADRLEKWLNQGYHGKMGYMANHFDKRVDPTKLVPGAKTVICLLYNYFPETVQQDSKSPKIAKYAYGEDYHFVLKKKLKKLLHAVREKYGDITGRVFVDSAPVMEREWASRSGLGWLGKNTLCIHPQKGSFFFLAEIILDLEFALDNPIKDYCGTCTKCIDACPTEAISPNGYLLDSSKCISYLTIELKEEIPTEFKDKMENWVFGCDICQDVCPWNRFSRPHQESKFLPNPQILEMNPDEWQEITEEVFKDIFRRSAVKRTKYEGLKRNLRFIRK